MAQKPASRPGDILLVVHEFVARSPDELSLAKGDKVELIERDDDFGDGWFLGKHIQRGVTGLFPEVYTTPVPKATLSSTNPRIATQRATSATSATSQTTTATSTDSAQPQLVPRSTASSASTAFTHTNGQQFTTSPNSSTTSFGNPYLPGSPGAPPPAYSPMAPISPQISESSASAQAPRPAPQHQGSTIMNETLGVIDEHITDMKKPGPRLTAADRKLSNVSNDSGSQYSTRLEQSTSQLTGEESDDEGFGTLTKRKVAGWSPAKAARYLESVGVEKSHCNVFKEQEFSGEVLLDMDQSMILLKELELGPIGRRLKTWQKIKNLQDEVKTPVPSRKQSSNLTQQQPVLHQHRRSTSGNIAPPSSYRQPESETRPFAPRAEPQLPAPQPAVAGGHTKRPSAASIRDMNQHRRHSSIGETLAVPGKKPDQPAHNKQSSFDKTWTMGAGPSRSANSSRPVSSVHIPSMSHDRGDFERLSPDLEKTVPAPFADTDKGYSSSGELEVKKLRKTLRKERPPEHERQSSHGSDWRRAGSMLFKAKTPSGSQKVQAAPAPAAPTTTPNNEEVKREANRIVSEPIISSTSPAVTKLEYDEESPRAAQAGIKESSVEGQHKKSTSRQSATRQSLRAISDAVTGRARAQTHIDGAIEEKTPTSPAHTGTSTPSAASKSFDLDETTKSEFSSPPPLVGSKFGSRQMKPKRKTSAYTRGLEKKTPREQMDGCDFSGWMKKKSSNLMTAWKPRLFVLRGRRLSYYYSEDDTEEKGVIDISNHKVLAADSDFLTQLHATLTNVSSSQPNSAVSPTKASSTESPRSAATTGHFNFPGHRSNTTSTADTAESSPTAGGANSTSLFETSQTFIFKVVPPRSGLQKAVNFTKPAVHYFAVPSLEEGRRWMAALIKATIDRDESAQVITTYKEQTISLEKARARKERPPALKDGVIPGQRLDGKDAVSGAREGESTKTSSIALTDPALEGPATEATDDAPVAEPESALDPPVDHEGSVAYTADTMSDNHDGYKPGLHLETTLSPTQTHETATTATSMSTTEMMSPSNLATSPPAMSAEVTPQPSTPPANSSKRQSSPGRTVASSQLLQGLGIEGVGSSIAEDSRTPPVEDHIRSVQF